MLHWHYVGHFDPRDALDRSEKPYKPKVVRPISKAAVNRCLAAFGDEVAEYVSCFPEGYVLCNWSIAPYKLWDRVHRFANALAEAEGAVIMSEAFIVEYPPQARQTQQEGWKR